MKRVALHMRLWLAGLAFAVSIAAPAHAHSRSQSFSTWTIEQDRVRVSFTVEGREVTRLPPLEGDIPTLDGLLIAHLSTRVQVLADGVACPTAFGPRALTAREGYVRVQWHFSRPPGTSVEIVNNAFFEVAPSHVHYARVRTGSDVPREYVFTDSVRRATVTASGAAEHTPSSASFLTYVGLGIEHIFGGLDHVAFLLTLLLLCRRVRDVLFMVTGFTLGHSVTLGLAVLGIVEPNVPIIEALIGFTIALVAIENIAVDTGSSRRVGLVAGGTLIVLGLVAPFGRGALPATTWIGLGVFTACHLRLSTTRERAAQLRPLLTVLFGLIHGFGFARVLMEIGLPANRLLPSLFGFNVGVEIGQLGIVAALWLFGSVAARYVPAHRRRLTFDLASASLCALGVFWFIGRSLP